jgi:hypothetical protein
MAAVEHIAGNGDGLSQGTIPELTRLRLRKIAYKSVKTSNIPADAGTRTSRIQVSSVTATQGWYIQLIMKIADVIVPDKSLAYLLVYETHYPQLLYPFHLLTAHFSDVHMLFSYAYVTQMLFLHYTVLAFNLHKKKRERQRAWPHPQSGGSRIVSKENAGPVFPINVARYKIYTHCFSQIERRRWIISTF